MFRVFVALSFSAVFQQVGVLWFSNSILRPSVAKLHLVILHPAEKFFQAISRSYGRPLPMLVLFWGEGGDGTV
jgi:hypothetical protein